MTDLTKALAELRRDRDCMKANADDAYEKWGAERGRAEAAEAENATLRAQVDRLMEALRFYADPHYHPNDGPWGVDSIDFGEIARAAIGGVERTMNGSKRKFTR